MGLVVDLFEIDALGFDGIALGNQRAREAGANQNQQQKIGADVLEQDWKQKRGQHSANLRERCRESSSRAANRNRKHLPCNEVGHGVGPDIGHEAERHETGKEQYGGRRSADVKRQRRKQQADGAAWSGAGLCRETVQTRAFCRHDDHGQLLGAVEALLSGTEDRGAEAAPWPPAPPRRGHETSARAGFAR
jgi:hypothetical protein